MRFLFVCLAALIFSFCNGETKDWAAKTENAAYIHRAIKKVTDVIVYDIYSPPVASRTYAYITIAGYETVVDNNPSYISFAGQLHGLKPTPKPEDNKTYSYTLAAVQAILSVGKNFVISEDKI